MLLRYVAPLVAGLYLAAPGFADTATPTATLPPTGVAADLPDEVERQGRIGLDRGILGRTQGRSLRRRSQDRGRQRRREEGRGRSRS